MFAIIGAFTFCGAAFLALLVITQMVRGYWPLIIAALNHQPLPRTIDPEVRFARRRTPTSSFTPRRLERDRAAA